MKQWNHLYVSDQPFASSPGNEDIGSEGYGSAFLDNSDVAKDENQVIYSNYTEGYGNDAPVMVDSHEEDPYENRIGNDEGLTGKNVNKRTQCYSVGSCFGLTKF